MVIAGKRDDHADSGKDLPGEVIWQFPMNSLSRLDHFAAPVAPAKIVRRREAVLISIRIGRGRVPSAWPIKSDRDQDLYRQLPFACQVGLRFRADRGILHGPFESAGRLQFWSTPSSAVQTKTRTLYLTEPSNP